MIASKRIKSFWNTFHRMSARNVYGTLKTIKHH